MKKNKTFFLLLLFSTIVLTYSNASAATITVTSNTNWSAISPAPKSTDAIVVRNDKTLTVDVSNAVCKSIQLGGWALDGTSGSGTLKFNASSQVTISGSVQIGTFLLNGNINMTDDGTLVCKGFSIVSLGIWTPGSGTVELTANNTLPNNASFTTFNNLTINGGNTTLSRGTTVNGTLTLTNGNIVSSSSKLLTLGALATVSGGGSSSFVKGPLAWITGSNLNTFPVGKKDTVYRPVQFTSLSGTNSSTMLQVEVFENGSGGTPGSGLDNLSYVRYFKISLTAGTITNFAVKLVYRTDDQVSVFGDLRVAAQTGADSVANLYGALGTNAGNNIGNGEITSNNAAWDGTNPIFLTLANVEGGGNALPVELASFSAAVNNNAVVLSWFTKTEKNNYGFNVEKKVGDNWNKIGFVQGNGNSNSPKNYSFSDKASNGTFSYRLKQINTDGSYVYSESIAVEVNAKPMKYNIANYPNPFNPSTIIQFELPQATHVNLTVYNLIGEKVVTLVNETMDAGVYQRTFTSNSYNGQLSSGIYFYRLSTDNGINITKKMVLAK